MRLRRKFLPRSRMRKPGKRVSPRSGPSGRQTAWSGTGSAATPNTIAWFDYSPETPYRLLIPKASEFPLKAELGLAGIQGLDEATIGRKPDVLADAEGVGVVGEVVEADAEEENAVVLPPYEALGNAQVDAEHAAYVEGIAVKAGRAGRDGVSTGAVEIGGSEGVDGARTAHGDHGRKVEVLAEVLQPLGRADIVERDFEQAAADR